MRSVVLGLDLDLDAVARRFWPKVAVGAPGECWPWTAASDPKGYGRFSVGGRKGRMDMAHRVAYVLHHRSDIPTGHEIDHVAARGCVMRSCCNPAHLDAVTHTENVRRWSSSITHCVRGHEFTPENTLRDKRNQRRCRLCEIRRDRARRQRARAAA